MALLGAFLVLAHAAVLLVGALASGLIWVRVRAGAARHAAGDAIWSRRTLGRLGAAGLVTGLLTASWAALPAVLGGAAAVRYGVYGPELLVLIPSVALAGLAGLGVVFGFRSNRRRLGGA